ncbi:hypothetical protein DUNSADRAFT_9766, partial [Dunaliella salina]
CCLGCGAVTSIGLQEFIDIHWRGCYAKKRAQLLEHELEFQRNVKHRLEGSDDQQCQQQQQQQQQQQLQQQQEQLQNAEFEHQHEEDTAPRDHDDVS